MRAAGVLGHVAPDRAGALTRWVWGKEETVGQRFFAELEVDHAWLNQGCVVSAVDLEDAIHARQADDDTALLRDGTPRETCPGTAGDDWETGHPGESDDVGDLFRARGQGDSGRRGSLDRSIDTSVVLVHQEIGRAGKDAIRSHDGLQLRDKRFSIHGRLLQLRSLD